MLNDTIKTQRRLLGELYFKSGRDLVPLSVHGRALCHLVVALC